MLAVKGRWAALNVTGLSFSSSTLACCIRFMHSTICEHFVQGLFSQSTDYNVLDGVCCEKVKASGLHYVLVANWIRNVCDGMVPILEKLGHFNGILTIRPLRAPTKLNTDQ